jgi:hypothetical protein
LKIREIRMQWRQFDDYLFDFGRALGGATHPVKESHVFCLGIPKGWNSVLSNMDNSGSLEHDIGIAFYGSAHTATFGSLFVRDAAQVFLKRLHLLWCSRRASESARWTKVHSPAARAESLVHRKLPSNLHFRVSGMFAATGCSTPADGTNLSLERKYCTSFQAGPSAHNPVLYIWCSETTGCLTHPLSFRDRVIHVAIHFKKNHVYLI